MLPGGEAADPRKLDVLGRASSVGSVVCAAAAEPDATQRGINFSREWREWLRESAAGEAPRVNASRSGEPPGEGR